MIKRVFDENTLVVQNLKLRASWVLNPHTILPHRGRGNPRDAIRSHPAVVVAEEAGDLPGGQEVVDVLKKPLVLHLVVREEERHGPRGQRRARDGRANGKVGQL